MDFYIQGLTLGLAYVAPIGMQNLFVINSALTQTRLRALVTALIVIHCFLKFISKSGMAIFVIYRLLLGALLLYIIH